MLGKKLITLTFALFIISIAAGALYYLKLGAKPVAVSENIVLPEAFFTDAEGKKHTLADFKGKTILVNLWATWCPPCVAELPSLDMLQAKLDDKNFEVVAISLDRGDIKIVTDFLTARGADHLKPYQDSTREISMKWKYSGVPVSFLIGADGNVIAQYDGPLEWHQGPVFDEVSRAVK